ncbi:MAG: GAF domain-containing protein [Bacillota bacterium]
MSENFFVENNLNDEEKYRSLLPQIESLLSENDPNVSTLANFTAALKQSFDKFSWVGFYLSENNQLYLGPFQGKVACTNIKYGQGVCGTAAAERKTIIVPDVDKFPGHIFCDADSKSEIVVPLLTDGNLYGILDVDSYLLNAFDQVDKHYLELLCQILTKKLL